MIDYRSIEHLHVFQDSLHVADLRRLPKGCQFKYTNAYIESGQPPIALHLPLNPEGITVEGIANLPTYFAGLLPEGVMFAAVKTLIGSAADDLFAILAATGEETIGDIDVRVPGDGQPKSRLNLADAADIVDNLLSKKKLARANSIAAIAGVQPKMSLGEIVRATRQANYIAKFESPEFPGLISNEYAFMRLASRCSLEVSSVKIRSNALVVTRFDRIFDQQTKTMNKVHMEDMLQVMDLFPNRKYSVDYAELITAMTRLHVSKATLLDALRLYVYSYVIGNGDLHAKNVSLIRHKDTGQWRLSPAYDLVSTLPYKNVLPGAERMALSLDDDEFGRFDRKDIVDFGAQFGLPERAVTGMIDQVVNAVVRYGDDTMADHVPFETKSTVLRRARSLVNADR